MVESMRPGATGDVIVAQHLAALSQGYTVRFTTLSEALADLLKQESLPALDR